LPIIQILWGQQIWLILTTLTLSDWLIKLSDMFSHFWHQLDIWRWPSKILLYFYGSFFMFRCVLDLKIFLLSLLNGLILYRKHWVMHLRIHDNQSQSFFFLLLLWNYFFGFFVFIINILNRLIYVTIWENN
jgi:hypothetical protein